MKEVTSETITLYKCPYCNATFRGVKPLAEECRDSCYELSKIEEEK